MSGWVDTISNTITSAIEGVRTPATVIPPIYLMYETKMRPGLSAVTLTANIISRLGEAGIDTSALPDGSQPSLFGFIRELVEEIIKELQLNGLANLVIDPGGIVVSGTPPCTGTNILPVNFKGIIR